MIKIGPFEIQSIINGHIRLDGGGMFGVVPKVLWQELFDVDDQNRVLLSTRTLLAVNREEKRVILVDTGCGTKWQPKSAQRYGIEFNPNAISEALKPMGLTVDDVTDVVITHLHFDHNGGLADWYDDPGGRIQPRYPQARYWAHKKHWEHACNPHPKDQASFLKEDFIGLADAGVIHFVEGDKPDSSISGMKWMVSHGHTPCQLHPVFEGDGESLLFVGDIIPTMAHLRLGWIMAFDVNPMTTIDEKSVVYQQCFEEGLKLAFPHDPEVGGVAIEGTVQKPIVTSQLDL